MKRAINSEDWPARLSPHHQHNPPPASFHHVPAQAEDTGMEGNNPDPSLNHIKMNYEMNKPDAQKDLVLSQWTAG